MSSESVTRIVRLANFIKGGNVAGAKKVFGEAKTSGETEILKATVAHIASLNPALTPETSEWIKTLQ